MTLLAQMIRPVFDCTQRPAGRATKPTARSAEQSPDRKGGVTAQPPGGPDERVEASVDFARRPLPHGRGSDQGAAEQSPDRKGGVNARSVGGPEERVEASVDFAHRPLPHGRGSDLRAALRGRFALNAWLTAALFLFASPVAAVPPGLEDADPSWVATWQYEVDMRVEMLASAYDLDDDGVATLRSELEARMLLQRDYEQKMMQELADLSSQYQEAGQALDDDDSPAAQEFTRRFIELTNQAPLADPELNQWMSARVPPEKARDGSRRYNELIERRYKQLAMESIDVDRYGGHKSTLTQEVIASRAEVPATHNRPMPPPEVVVEAETQEVRRKLTPHVKPKQTPAISMRSDTEGPAVQEPAPPVVQPQPPVRQASRPPAAQPQPDRAKPSQPISPPRPTTGSTPPQPAPPLDEWEKYVLSVAAKYEFDESQMTNARAILSDLRRRAYQYRASRAEDYARAELMTDAKARAEELKNLNRPQDAMFEELKARLESLPTMSQRQKAGAASPARKK